MHPPAHEAAHKPTQAASAPDFELTWECPNCGQQVFGKHPPDICDYCDDFTTWRLVVKSSD